MPDTALLEVAQFEYQILLLYQGTNSENIGLVNNFFGKYSSSDLVTVMVAYTTDDVGFFRL